MGAPEHHLLAEAADWLVKLQAGEADEEALTTWCQRSPQHARTWQRAERLLNSLEAVPTAIGQQTFHRLGDQPLRRRQLLNRLGLMAMAAPALYAGWRLPPWNTFGAELRTAVGEQRRFALADGTQLILNTDSAVDIRFAATERRLVLRAGEILVTTAPDSAARPFRVESPQGMVTALGTRFSVRLEGERTRVAVFAERVEIAPAHGLVRPRLAAGQTLSFTATDSGVIATLPQGVDRWEQGMLVAQDMPLTAWVAEIGRYRPGLLSCAAPIGDLQVSGAFPIRDTDLCLRLLTQGMPVRLREFTRYWIRIEAA